MSFIFPLELKGVFRFFYIQEVKKKKKIGAMVDLLSTPGYGGNK